MKFPLSSKVTVFITAIVLVFSLASASFLFITHKRMVMKEITARGTTMAESLARAVAEGIASEDLGVIRQVQSIVRTDDVLLAQVYSSVWLPIDSYPGDNFHSAPVDPEALRLLEADPVNCYLRRANTIDFYTPVTYHQLDQPTGRKYVIGYVRLKLSTRQADAVLLRYVITFFAGALALTLVAILVLNGMIRKLVLKPIEQLNRAVSTAVGSDTFLPVAVSSQDEIGELSANFNRMFAAIRERERSLRESEANLQQVEKLESLGLLAGGIAHDFNNILTAIIGNISFARNYLDESDQASGILGKAEKAARQAGDLAHQLLTFAKGGQPIKQTASLRPILEESASLVLRGANVACRIQLPDDLLPAEVDPGQISQVANNILINATQAMPEGGTIRIQGENLTLAPGNRMALAPGRYLRITLADTGCGISEENQKKIFDPYFSTKAGGSGLGLASAHSIVIRHGGFLGVHSELGTGTTFEMVLPASDRPVAAGRPEPVRVGLSPGAGQPVLVMDDEPIIRDVSSAMLAAMGHQVQTCISGEEAIDRYRAARDAGRPYSAVIMDLTIPGGMGGKEAARHILAMDPQARLIVSSGYSNDPIMADPAQSGFCAMLMKPYSLAEMTRVMGMVLGG